MLWSCTAMFLLVLLVVFYKFWLDCIKFFYNIILKVYILLWRKPLKKLKNKLSIESTIIIFPNCKNMNLNFFVSVNKRSFSIVINMVHMHNIPKSQGDFAYILNGWSRTEFFFIANEVVRREVASDNWWYCNKSCKLQLQWKF